jgi:putative SOS response-associated peptidase YedK
MFKRYVLPDQLAAEREFLPAQAWWQFEPRFNVAAHQYVPAIRVHDRQSEAVMMRWGLIPSWAEGKPVGDPPTCVDAEQIQDSIAHQEPWLHGRRCILPIAGFYVWQLHPERYRQPYFVHLTSRAVFGVAAIWDRSVSEEDDVIESCSAVCVEPNELLGDIGSPLQRMPAILRRKDYQTWLHGTPVQAQSVLMPYQPDWMQAYPVSPRINSTAPDDAGLIRPVH